MNDNKYQAPANPTDAKLEEARLEEARLEKSAEISPEREVTLLSILASVFCSFFGLQNNANRKRDFESGKFWHFFTAGLIFVVAFLLSVWGAVKYMLATTPAG